MGRKDLPTRANELGMTEAGRQMLTPELIPSLEGKHVVSVTAGHTSAHVIAITVAGTVYGWGRNEGGQLGIADLRRRNCPTEVQGFSGAKIVRCAAGKSFTWFIGEGGEVFATGSNACGQLGLGSLGKKMVTKVTKVDVSPLGSAKAVRVSCGMEFTVVVADDGSVYACGHPEYGQTGQGSTGMYITGRKEEYNYAARLERVNSLKGTKIVDVACGAHSSVALDDNGRIWTWGFGAYGRLGHKTPKDELVPRMVDKLTKVAQIFAGSKFHYAVTDHHQCYFWGQSKASGEATMFPKMVQDLSGVHVRDMACGPTTTMVCFNESLAAWGPSPAYGELCYGETETNRFGIVKTSTKPKSCDLMEGVVVLSVALGLQFSVMVVESGSKVVENLNVLDEEDVNIDVSFAGAPSGVIEEGGAKEAGPKKRGRPAGGGKAKVKKRK